MTERDYKILKKIAENQKALSDMVKEFKIVAPEDLSKIHAAIRRGIVGFISDLFELTKPLSESVQPMLPFNRTVIKRFRDTASHRYGTITNTIAHACLMHCIDKNSIQAINKLIEDYSDL
ncbi:MAG: hypothetical protein FWB80_01645 [Defluviitaleaceae bacterium]|nr:hypothetical protein [Defluviitaleaceae bacterium]